MNITQVSLKLLIYVLGRINTTLAVIPALKKLTVEVADDDVSGTLSILNL